MAKISLTDTAGGYNAAATTNANNDLIEAAVENQLSRDGSSPNQMEAQLDMNSNRITNLPDAVNQQDPITLAQAGVIAGLENPLTQDSVAAVFLPQTALEAANGITPVELQFHEGNVMRYGAKADSASGVQGTDDWQAFQDAVDSGHPVFVPPGRYSIESTIEIISTSAEDGGKTFIMSGLARLERYTNVSTPIIHAVGAQSYVDGHMGTLAARNFGSFTSGLLLIGQDPNGTFGGTTEHDLTNAVVQNFKIIGKNSNTGWDGSVGMYCESAARRRGDWVAGGNINSYYNSITNIYVAQCDYGIFCSTDFNANSFDGCTVIAWGHAAYWINGYSNQFNGCKLESPVAQDTTERWGWKWGNKDSGPEAVNAACEEAATKLVISGISAANPAVVTVTTAHGIVATDVIKLDLVVDNGPDGDLETAVNTGTFTATQTGANTFSIPIDTSGLTNVYASGGEVNMDPYPIIGARANQATCFSEIQFDTSTKRTRLFSQTRPIGARSTEKIHRGTFGKNILRHSGTVSGGITTGDTDDSTMLNNTIHYTHSYTDYDKPWDLHNFKFRKQDDISGDTFGRDESKMFGGRKANVQESTSTPLFVIDNIGATGGGVLIKFTYACKADGVSFTTMGEVVFACSLKTDTTYRVEKISDSSTSFGDTKVATPTCAVAIGTATNTMKVSFGFDTHPQTGTPDHFMGWKAEVTTTQLENSNVDWDEDLTFL